MWRVPSLAVPSLAVPSLTRPGLAVPSLTGPSLIGPAPSTGSFGPPSRRLRPGGGTAGTGIGFEASLEPTRTRVRLASWVATRLRGPLTGVLGVKIQPTPGTGLPPTRRDWENSQSCSPWNS